MKNQIIVIISVLIIAMPLGLADNIKSNNNKTYENTDSTFNTYIDPKIVLTKKHLPTLHQSYNNINNLEVKNFIYKIIELIKEKEIIYEKDIENVIKNQNLDTKIKGIHFLCLLNSNGIGYAYPRGIMPFIFDYIFYKIFFTEMYIGPSIYVEWRSPDADTKINGKKIYNESHNGYIFGFFGYTFCDGIWPVIYHTIGISTLVIITEYDYIKN